MLSLEDLKQLNIISYKSRKTQLEYGLIENYNDVHSGLNSCLYNYKNSIVLCFVGTNGIQDICNDKYMNNNIIPEQARKAQEIYNKVNKKYKDFILTGHSLGGSVAQILGAIFGNATVCFSPFGTSEFNCGKFNNITNYGMETDAVFIRNIDKQIGKTYIIPSIKTDKHFIINGQINYKALALGKTKMFSPRGHLLEGYNSFSKAVLLDTYKLYNELLSIHI